jgi:predicted TIM-barrel fold metal-dependent hydrolase
MTEQEVLDPGVPIVDPHHHLWASASGVRYLLDEFVADLDSGHDIRATVYVEAAPTMYRRGGPDSLRALGEVEFANGIAAMSASGSFGPVRVAAAIVAHADLELEEAALRDVLDAYVAVAGERFRGIRQATFTSAVPALLRDPRFRRGFGLLVDRGLTFDAIVRPEEIPDVSDLAGAFPEAAIVLDHIGMPDGADVDLWRRSVRDLARHRNVSVKIGGLGMLRLGVPEGAHPGSAELAEIWGPYVEVALDEFGPSRCMFESNFPMDAATCDYRTLWNTFARLATGYSHDEKADVFGGTASRFYGLPIPRR